MNPFNFLYIAQWDRFIFRRKGAWDRLTTYSKEAIAHHLAAKNLDAKAVKKVFNERKYDMVHEVVMAPGREEKFTDDDGLECLNTWVAPTLVPTPGVYPSIETLLSHLTKDDTKAREWLINWMAWKVQDPAVVPKVATVITTEPGGGKGTLAFILRQMLGPKNCETIEKEDLESRFNAKWIDKIFVLADEVLSSDNRADVSDRLKVLIDAEYVTREGKGRDQQTIKSHLSWMFASNSQTSPVVVERGDRRYSVFANHNPIDPEGPYAQMLKGLFLPGGKATPAFEAEMAAFAHDLHNHEVDKDLASRPFVNSDRKDLIEASLSSTEAFFLEMIENGIEALILDVPEYSESLSYQQKYKRVDWDMGDDGVTTQAIYDAYKWFCKQQGQRSIKLNKLGTALKRHPANWTWSRPTHKTSGKRLSCYNVPRRPKT